MASRDRHAKPDEWEQGIRQPIHPTEARNIRAIFVVKIQPHIEKLIDAKSGDEISSEAFRTQVLLAYIKVAFKWRNAPTQRTFGDYSTAAPKSNSYISIFHTT